MKGLPASRHRCCEAGLKWGGGGSCDVFPFLKKIPSPMIQMFPPNPCLWLSFKTLKESVSEASHPLGLRLSNAGWLKEPILRRHGLSGFGTH